MTGLVKEPSQNNGLGSLVPQVTVTATGQSAVVSRSIAMHGTDGLRKLWDATTPNPLRRRRGLEFWGRGTGGGGLTALPPATV